METTTSNQGSNIIDMIGFYKTCLQSKNYTITSFNAISKEKQMDIIRNAQNGDKKCMEYLILSNLNFVKFIIRRYYYSISNIKEEDLFQLGIIGLFIGISKYETEDIEFSTWVSYYIRRYIGKNSMSLFFDTTVTDITIRNAALYQKLLKERKEIGKTLTDEEAKRILNLSDKKLKTLKLFLDRRTEYLDNTSKYDDANQKDRNIYLVDESRFSIDNVINNISSYELLVFLKETLSPIEYFVLYNRVLTETPMLDREISALFNGTRQYIYQIEVRAKRKIKSLIDKDGQSEKRRIIELEIKRREKSNYYNINILPINPEDIYSFLYLRDTLSQVETQVLYEKLFGKYIYDRNQLSNKLGISIKELIKIETHLNNLLNELQTSFDYQAFRTDLINEYHTKIYEIDLLNDEIKNGLQQNHSSHILTQELV